LRTSRSALAARPRVPLAVSQGFGCRYHPDQPRADQVRIQDLRFQGMTLTPDSRVRVTANAFLTAGGNGFTALTAGTARVTGIQDRDAPVA